MLEKILNAWCRHMHKNAMWPIHGRYICSQCMREHRVEWEPAPIAPRVSRPVVTASASMDACA